MNKKFVVKGGVYYTVIYSTDANDIDVIYAIYGTLDDDCDDCSFKIPTLSDAAKRKALEILGLNEDYWGFADE